MRGNFNSYYSQPVSNFYHTPIYENYQPQSTILPIQPLQNPLNIEYETLSYVNTISLKIPLQSSL